MHLNKDKLSQGKKARKQKSKKGRKKETVAYQLLVKLHRNSSVNAGIDSSIGVCASLNGGLPSIFIMHRRSLR
jgi:hypothetical protein